MKFFAFNGFFVPGRGYSLEDGCQADGQAGGRADLTGVWERRDAIDSPTGPHLLGEKSRRESDGENTLLTNALKFQEIAIDYAPSSHRDGGSRAKSTVDSSSTRLGETGAWGK